MAVLTKLFMTHKSVHGAYLYALAPFWRAVTVIYIAQNRHRHTPSPGPVRTIRTGHMYLSLTMIGN